MATPYTDGTFTAVKQVGPTRLIYPFLNNPTKDATTKQYETDYVVLPGSYTPASALNTFPGDGIFTANANAYLVEETPISVGRGDYRVTRRWSTIPTSQTYPSSRMFDRPILHDVFAGALYCVSFDDGGTSTVFASRLTVNSISTPDVPNTANINNGSTPGTLSASVTISFTGNNSTQTFASNASDSTIQNALSTAVTGGTGAAANFKIARNVSGITVSVVTTNTTISALSSDSAAVIATPLTTLGLATGGEATDLFSLKAADVNAASVRTVTTSTTHGYSAGNLVALWNGNKLWTTGLIVAVPTTTTFTVQLDEIPGKDAAITACARANDGIRFINGPKECSTRTIQSFYLPSVTANVATASDIPGTPLYGTPVAWINRISNAVSGATATAASDTINATSHGLIQGDIFWLTAIGSGAGNLATNTLYSCIYVDENNFKVASSQANALAGTAIDISSDGTGITFYKPGTWQNIAVADLTQWQGPILMKSVDQVQMSDAIEQVSSAS